MAIFPTHMQFKLFPSKGMSAHVPFKIAAFLRGARCGDDVLGEERGRYLLVTPFQALVAQVSVQKCVFLCFSGRNTSISF